VRGRLRDRSTRGIVGVTELDIDYRMGTVGLKQLREHLEACDGDFHPRLSERVDLAVYSGKISERAMTFEAWAGNDLVGLVAVYLNDPDRCSGYISCVSTLRRHAGRGIAGRLLDMCLASAKGKGFREISLEVHAGNGRAIELYRRAGFEDLDRHGAFLSMKLEMSQR